jgi:glycosyltransferase involved in cell wall biosynthesis
VKAPDLLLDASARLSARGQDFRLWLIGDGPLRRGLVRRAETLGLGVRVRFLGALPHDQLPDHFRAADLTVLSSHSEGVPNVLRESLACGTPFVATRVGGIADIATSDCELVNPGDPAALAEAMARKLAEPSVKRPVAPFTWKESAETIRRVLAQHIESRR